MAGTRLLLTAISLGQLILLSGMAFLVGLCQMGDLACAPYYFDQSGRSLLRNAEPLLMELLTLPPIVPASTVRVATPPNQVAVWEEFMQQQQQQQQQQFIQDRVAVVPVDNQDIWESICRGTTSPPVDGSSLLPLADVWICSSDDDDDGSSNRHTAHVVLHPDGSMIFYPRRVSLSNQEQSKTGAASDWSEIYPQMGMYTTDVVAATTTASPRLDIIIVLEQQGQVNYDNNYNKSNSKIRLDRIQQWLGRQGLDDWPFFGMTSTTTGSKGYSVTFRMANLSSKARKIQHQPQDSVDIDSNSTTTTSSFSPAAPVDYYELHVEHVESLLDDLSRDGSTGRRTTTRDDSTSLSVTLFVPSLVPMILVDRRDADSSSSNESLSLSSQQFVVRHSYSSDDDNRNSSCWFAILPDEANGQAVVDELFDHVLAKYLGIPDAVLGHHSPTITVKTATTAHDSHDHTNDTSSVRRVLPHLYMKLWYQRHVQYLYQQAVSTLVTEKHRLLATSHSVAISEPVARVWLEAATLVQRARTAKDPNDWMSTMSSSARLLHQALVGPLALLQRDAALAEPLDWSVDHYAGIFVPLLLPMLIPLLLGLVREIRRYRELQQKKQKQQPTTIQQQQQDDEKEKGE